MPFKLVSEIADLLRERRRDCATIQAIEQGKRDGRNRTGLRDIPTGPMDIQRGDSVGDYLDDALYRYELRRIEGDSLWHQEPHNIGW